MGKHNEILLKFFILICFSFAKKNYSQKVHKTKKRNKHKPNDMKF